MRGRRGKNKGHKKAEVISTLQGVEFDIDAIREIKKRKRGLCKRKPNRKG